MSEHGLIRPMPHKHQLNIQYINVISESWVTVSYVKCVPVVKASATSYCYSPCLYNVTVDRVEASYYHGTQQEHFNLIHT